MAYQIDIDYVVPKPRLDGDFREEEYILLYIPLESTPVNAALRKDDVMDLLRFLYQQEYGDMFQDDPDRDPPWRAYMAELLAKYEQELPDPVPIAS